MKLKRLKTKLIKDIFILRIINDDEYIDYVYFKGFDNTRFYSTLTNNIKRAKKFYSLNEAEMFLIKNKLTNYIPIQVEV